MFSCVQTYVHHSDQTRSMDACHVVQSARGDQGPDMTARTYICKFQQMSCSTPLYIPYNCCLYADHEIPKYDPSSPMCEHVLAPVAYDVPVSSKPKLDKGY